MNKILASLAMASFLMTGSAMAQTSTATPAAKHAMSKHMTKKGSKKAKPAPAASTAP